MSMSLKGQNGDPRHCLKVTFFKLSAPELCMGHASDTRGDMPMFSMMPGFFLSLQQLWAHVSNALTGVRSAPSMMSLIGICRGSLHSLSWLRW